MFHSSVICKIKQQQIVSLFLYYFVLFFFSTAPDTTPPTFIQCPTQPITRASTGVNTLVTFTEPTATDNCGTVNVACTAVSPSNTAIALTTIGNQEQGSFPVGTSTVTCTATDSANPAATCTFNVAVTQGMLNDVLKFK